MPKTVINLVSFTDPYCTWCWGSEPILRKIEEVYGEQVSISFVMGGLVEDIRNFSDPFRCGVAFIVSICILMEVSSFDRVVGNDKPILFVIFGCDPV